jgi:hypothetical protein
MTIARAKPVPAVPKRPVLDGARFAVQLRQPERLPHQYHKFCKANPSSGQALNVSRGKLTDGQAYELMMSCPNIPHGSIPYSGSPPAPGSKKMQQCQAFEKTYSPATYCSAASTNG